MSDALMNMVNSATLNILKEYGKNERKDSISHGQGRDDSKSFIKMLVKDNYASPEITLNSADGKGRRELYDYHIMATNKLSYIDVRYDPNTKAGESNRGPSPNLFDRASKEPPIFHKNIMTSRSRNASNSLGLNGAEFVDSKNIKSEDGVNQKISGKVILPDAVKVSLLYSGGVLNVYIRDKFTQHSELIILGVKLLKSINMKGSKLFINGREA